MGVTRSAAVLAHGFADAGALPVSTPLLLVGAAAVALAATRLTPRTSDAPPPLTAAVRPRAAAVLRAGTAVALALTAAVAALGAQDAAANPAGRLLFTVGWAGVLLAAVVVGPWWRHASPLRWVATGSAGPAPTWGVWPAVAVVVLFGAAEQLADPSPLVALTVVAVYVVVGAAGAAVWGGGWLSTADPVEVATAALGSLAPLGRDDGDVVSRSPRAGVRAADAPDGLAAFLGVLVGLSLFDAATTHGGPSSPWWFLMWVGGSAALFTAVARPRPLTVALVPAAAAHLAAHYVAPLLIDTQVAVVQASDPFGRGWDLLGLTGREIVAEPIPPEAGLALQVVLLVAGHALAMVTAGDAVRGDATAAARSALFGLRTVLVASLLAGVYLWAGP